MDIPDSLYDIYELDSGELYVVEKETGDIFQVDFSSNHREYEERINTNKIEEIKELKKDYEDINTGISKLKEDMRDLAKKRGIVIRKKTRKELVQDYRKRKNSNDLTEDLTSKEFFDRKERILRQRAKPNVYIPEDEIELDGEITETLMDYERKEREKTMSDYKEKVKKYKDFKEDDEEEEREDMLKLNLKQKHNFNLEI